MNNYIIKISELALITLDENISFLESFNITYSIKMRKCIIQAIDNLVIFPHSHPIYKKTDKHVYRKLAVKKQYHII